MVSPHGGYYFHLWDLALTWTSISYSGRIRAIVVLHPTSRIQSRWLWVRSKDPSTSVGCFERKSIIMTSGEYYVIICCFQRSYGKFRLIRTMDANAKDGTIFAHFLGVGLIRHIRIDTFDPDDRFEALSRGTSLLIISRPRYKVSSRVSLP